MTSRLEVPQHLDLGVLSRRLSGARFPGSPKLLWAGFVLSCLEGVYSWAVSPESPCPSKAPLSQGSPVCRKRASPRLSAAAVPLAPWAAL